MKRKLTEADRKRLEAKGVKVTPKEQAPQYDVLGAALAGVARDMEARLTETTQAALERAQERFQAALAALQEQTAGATQAEARVALDAALERLLQEQREAIKRDREALLREAQAVIQERVSEMETPTLPMPSSVTFEYDANGFARTLEMDTGERFEVEFTQGGRPRRLVPVTH